MLISNPVKSELALRKICDVHSANREIVAAVGTVSPTQSASDPARYFLDFYAPEIALEDGQFRAGRVLHQICGELNQKALKRSDMVATLIHSRLIEQIMVAVDQSEPVLLVGETGTGKTSCIQYCAARSGHRLRVVNMSRQSQAGDLIGAFRPVDRQTIIRPVFRKFHLLMVKSFSTKIFDEDFL